MSSDNSIIPTASVGRYEQPCGEPPAAGAAREVAPGVLWLRMPLPFSLAHINLWAVRDGAGWALVDTGIHSEATATAWRQLFAAGGALGGEQGECRATRVFVTHMHPDHVGMAGWLTRKFDCPLWMTRLEYLHCRMLVADTGREAPQDALRFYRHAGWDENAIEHYRTRFGNFGKMVYALPDSFRRLHDGEQIRIGEHDWQVVVGSGHSPEHACLFCPALKLLISGDQVLPSISSNVSVFPTEPDADPLGEWLASIDKLRLALPADLLVLPAHGEPFVGLHSRLDSLASGHERGLQRLQEALQEPKRVVDVFGTLFRRRVDADASLLGLATGEALAHLNHLVQSGRAERSVHVDGAARYQAPARNSAGDG